MRSMTGYGRRRIDRDGREMTVEIKTVNHRFLDIAFRMPRALSFAEDAVRKQIGASFKRGHVDVNVTYQNLRQDAREVRVDEGLARQYRDAMLHVRRTIFEVGVQASPDEIRHLSDKDVTFIASQPDVMQVTVAEEDQEAVLSLLSDTLAQALEDASAMREKEGAALREDLSHHLSEVKQLRGEIALLAPKVPSIYQEKLQARIRELGVQEIDPQRLAQEVALMADRCAIDEELSRLLSHIEQMNDAIHAEGETGRRLDFLTQELNREVNTIGSKASDAEITKLVVAAKSEIEKLREQVQNVE
ncbi:MAG: YicC family protein [Clostridia bacterium]|nr:YicC family protein [Clostridia bacterium]